MTAVTDVDVLMRAAVTTGLDGLVAVVTGGGSGVGAACVRAMVSTGARVGVLDLDPGARTDPCTLPLTANVADTASVETALATVAAEFGGIDVLVNCAGVSAARLVAESDDAEWHRVLDVNVVGVARVSRAALPYLRRSRHASVVNISSAAAWAGTPNRALHSASEGAVHALTLAMAADLAGSGVRVNCVCPSTVDGGLGVARPGWAPTVERAGRGVGPAAPVASARVPGAMAAGVAVSIEEVATAVCYLASPDAGATTGAALAVDGTGYGLRLR